MTMLGAFRFVVFRNFVFVFSILVACSSGSSTANDALTGTGAINFTGGSMFTGGTALTGGQTLGGGTLATGGTNVASGGSGSSGGSDQPDASVGGGSSNTGDASVTADSGPTPTPVNEPPIVSGCGSSSFYEADEDPSVPGPWPVGVKTISVPVSTGGSITAEIWYPAKLGSETGKDKATYDLRDWLPTGAVMIPDSANKLAECDCYRDLPLDTDHGPYPAVVHIHGLGSFRIASASAMTAWASRGVVVVAADHPGDMLTDYLVNVGLGSLQGCSTSNVAGGDMKSEATDEINHLINTEGDFAFLSGVLDTTRLGLSGHSQGGGTVAGMGDTPNVLLIMTQAPLSGGTISPAGNVESMLQVTGMSDSVVGYSTNAYTNSTMSIKREIGITGGGHIDVTDLCSDTNADGQTAIEVANSYGVCGAAILSGLAQCGTDAAATAASPKIVDYATTAAVEETLLCRDRTAAFADITNKFPEIGEYLHTP